MNPLTQTINQRKMNERELEAGVAGTKNSWHMEYRDSAWIFLGGLPYEMTEGDVICMFSQYGEVVHINLIRDHGTGKSKGFGFLCYMDQRSTILAVDNLNGVKVLSRMIRVDHVHQYKLPKDLEKLDQDKRKLFEEGCAPKEIDIEYSESSEEEVIIKQKKEKKKKEKKKKKKRRHSTSSDTDTDSDSEDDRRRKDEKSRKYESEKSRRNSYKEDNERRRKDDKSRKNENGWDRKNDSRRDGENGNRVIKEEKSLEDRLKDMADYVRMGESRDAKRMSAKDMFEKEKGDDGRSRLRDQRSRSRSRSGRRNNTRRSRSYEKEKSRNYRRSSSRGRSSGGRRRSSSRDGGRSGR